MLLYRIEIVRGALAREGEDLLILLYGIDIIYALINCYNTGKRDIPMV